MSDYYPATLIYNPHAGVATWEEQLRKVVRFWHGRGWQITLAPTKYAGHATVLAREAVAAGQHLVIAAGGDGTLHEVANGLIGSDVILTVLPVGTANSFAKELGLVQPNLLESQRLLEASNQLAHGRVQRMDVGRTGDGRHWLLWVGAGVDGYVVDQIEPRSKLFKRLGMAGYAAKALYFLPGFGGLRATITIDGNVYQDNYLMVNISNCRQFAGGEFTLNAQGVLDDGLFEVWLFQDRGWQWPNMLRYTLEVGLENHLQDPHIEMLTGRRIKIETTPNSPYHLDAEPAGHTPVTCEVVPQALRILVPQTVPAGLFTAVGEPLP